MDAGPDGVVVPAATVVLDAGAHAHRPDRWWPSCPTPSSTAGRCSRGGRSSWCSARPPTRTGWAEAVGLVDALQDLDVDARLACPSPPAGLTLVQPALASRGDPAHASAPTSVVAWDAGAVDRGRGLVEPGCARGSSSGPGTVPVVGAGARGGSASPRAGCGHASAARADAGPPRGARPPAARPDPQPEAPDPTVVIGRPTGRGTGSTPRIGVHREPPPRHVCTSSVRRSPTARRTADGLRRAPAACRRGGASWCPPARPAGRTPRAPTSSCSRASASSRRPRRSPARRTGRHRRSCSSTVRPRRRRAARRDGRAGRSAAPVPADRRHRRRPADPAAPRRRAARRGPSGAERSMTSRRYRELARAHAERHATRRAVIGWVPGERRSPGPAIRPSRRRCASSSRAPAARRRPRARRRTGSPATRASGASSTGSSRTGAARWAASSRPGFRGAPAPPRAGRCSPRPACSGCRRIVAAAGWAAGARTHRGGRSPTTPEPGSPRSAALLDDPPAREQLVVRGDRGRRALHRPAAADAVVHRFLGWVEGARQ